MNSFPILHSYWLKLMEGHWGHPTGCGCVVCRQLKSLCGLIREHSNRPGFVPHLGHHLRLVESLVREEVDRYPPSVPGLPVFFGIAPGPPPAEPHPGLLVPPAHHPVPPAPPANSPPVPEPARSSGIRKKGPEHIGLAGKGVPQQPPDSLSPSQVHPKVKREPTPNPSEQSPKGVVDVGVHSPSPPREERSTRGRHRSVSRSRRREEKRRTKRKGERSLPRQVLQARKGEAQLLGPRKRSEKRKLLLGKSRLNVEAGLGQGH